MVARRGTRWNTFIFLSASDGRFRTVGIDLILFRILGRLNRHVAIWSLLLSLVSHVALSDLLGQLLVLVDDFVKLLGCVIVLLL